MHPDFVYRRQKAEHVEKRRQTMLEKWRQKRAGHLTHPINLGQLREAMLARRSEIMQQVSELENQIAEMDAERLNKTPWWRRIWRRS